MSTDSSDDWPIIISPVTMPVCLSGDRLRFTAPCHLHTELMDIVGLDWTETEQDSYDGASIPRWAWSIVGHPLQQEFRWPSYWHDRLCENSRSWAERRLADAVLLVLLEEWGVSWWRRTAMWLAVRGYAWWGRRIDHG